MRTLIIYLISATWGIAALAGTCTSISRTNNSANTVLTSTKYNADLNTSYSNQNAYDLGCGTDGTLEKTALDTTDFTVPLNYFKDGCKVIKSTAAALTIEKCVMAINGEWLQTTAGTSATWGCSGCASEANSTEYYIYAKDGSTGATLTPLISTTAPDSDGYSSGNKILAKFYNNGSGDIVDRIAMWNGYAFNDREIFSARIDNDGTATITGQTGTWISSVNRPSLGQVEVNFVTGLFTVIPSCSPVSAGSSEIQCKTISVTTSTCLVLCENLAGANVDKNFAVTAGRLGADVW